MGSTYSQPLTHKGPFRKPTRESSFLGIPVTNYTMPLVNPEDGSYMPTCAPGPCVQYVYQPYFDRGVMRQRSHCVRYGPPTRIPQQTNMFSLQPGNPRHSCGWSDPSNDSQYYVAYNPQSPIPQPPPNFLANKGPEYQYGKTFTGGLKRGKKKKTLKNRRTK